MISDQEIQQAIAASEHFKPAILTARYYRDIDRVEFETPWCVISVNRNEIEEFRAVSPDDMETISVSDVGVHIDNADIDINSAGLIAEIAKRLETEVANSF
jgi:hypothetical protein